MESEHYINEMRRIGEVSGGDPNEIIESSYSGGFQNIWQLGFDEGFAAGQEKAMKELNIRLPDSWFLIKEINALSEEKMIKVQEFIETLSTDHVHHNSNENSFEKDNHVKKKYSKYK